MKKIVQEEPMGCAVACVAARLGIRYTEAKKLFRRQSSAATTGYYCTEIIAALEKKGVHCQFEKAKKGKTSHIGDIVFIRRSKKYPAGHYLLKTPSGWMNPWINYPCIAPAKPGFENRLPGNAQYTIKEIKR